MTNYNLLDFVCCESKIVCILHRLSTIDCPLSFSSDGWLLERKLEGAGGHVFFCIRSIKYVSATVVFSLKLLIRICFDLGSHPKEKSIWTHYFCSSYWHSWSFNASNMNDSNWACVFLLRTTIKSFAIHGRIYSMEEERSRNVYRMHDHWHHKIIILHMSIIQNKKKQPKQIIVYEETCAQCAFAMVCDESICIITWKYKNWGRSRELLAGKKCTRQNVFLLFIALLCFGIMSKGPMCLLCPIAALRCCPALFDDRGNRHHCLFNRSVSLRVCERESERNNLIDSSSMTYLMRNTTNTLILFK